MKLKSVLLSLLILATGVIPASAWEIPAPSWAADTGAPSNFSWGNWLPCDPAYRTFDCIAEVKWLRSNGNSVKGEFIPQQNFNYKTFTSIWVKDGNQDAQYMEPGIGSIGWYNFDGLTTPCGNSHIFIDVRAVHGSMQVNAQSTCGQFFTSKFEERFSVSLKSSVLKGFIGGVSSNGHAPTIDFEDSGSESLLTISAEFAYIPWNNGPTSGSWLNICTLNNERAVSGGWGLWNSIFFGKMFGDMWLLDHPGDMITGTNGWNCGGVLRWDPNEKGLVMSVGAPHFNPDGSLVEGWFEGDIRGRFVKARYGITPQEASGNARLEIIYDNGEKKVATITAKYNAVTDVISFRAYGFHYSAPKLVLKFDKANAVDASTSTTNSKGMQLLKEITCLKGKTIKRVRGVNPKCPSGYKKKA